MNSSNTTLSTRLTNISAILQLMAERRKFSFLPAMLCFLTTCETAVERIKAELANDTPGFRYTQFYPNHNVFFKEFERKFDVNSIDEVIMAELISKVADLLINLAEKIDRVSERKIVQESVEQLEKQIDLHHKNLGRTKLGQSEPNGSANFFKFFKKQPETGAAVLCKKDWFNVACEF